MQIVTLRDSLHEVSNRMEGNDQVSIHLPNNFCSKKSSFSFFLSKWFSCLFVAIICFKDMKIRCVSVISLITDKRLDTTNPVCSEEMIDRYR